MPTRIAFIILEWLICTLQSTRTPQRLLSLSLHPDSEMDHLPLQPYQNPQRIVFCHFRMGQLPTKAYQNPQRVLSLSFWNGPFTN